MEQGSCAPCFNFYTMSPIQTLLTSAVINACVLGLAIFAVQRMLITFTKKIEESIQELKTEDDKIWRAINTHGHKGLNENNARVTR